METCSKFWKKNWLEPLYFQINISSFQMTENKNFDVILYLKDKTEQWESRLAYIQVSHILLYGHLVHSLNKE